LIQTLRTICSPIWLLKLLLILCMSVPALAVSKPPNPSKLLTLEAVQAKLEAVDKNKSLNDESREQVRNLLQLAINSLENTQQADEQATAFRQAIATAPKETRRLRAQIAQTPDKQADVKLTTGAVPELMQRQEQLQAKLGELRTELEQLDNQLRVQRSRPSEARTQLATAQERRDGLAKDLKRQTSSPAIGPLADAQLTAIRAQQLAADAEVSMLEQELLSHDARIELLQAQRDLAAQTLPLSEAQEHALQDALTRQQKVAADQAQADARQAEQEALGKHAAVRHLAEQNAALGQEFAKTVDLLDKTNKSQEAAEAEAKQIEQDFQSTRQKYEIAGLSLALGQILREQRRKLPEIEYFQHDSKSRQQEVARVGLDALHIDEQRAAIKDSNQVLQTLMRRQVDADMPHEERDKVESELRKLLQDQRGLLDNLANADTSYLRALGDIDFAQRRLIDNAQRYATFLDERLLWIPSAAPLGRLHLTNLVIAAEWLVAPANWTAATRSLMQQEGRQQSEWVLALALCAVLSLIGLRRRLRARLDTISKLVAKPYTDRFIYTLQALLCTLLLAAPVPLAVAVLGLRLQGLPATADGFAKTLGAGFTHVSLPLFFFIALYRLCRVDGVAEDHFHWQDGALRTLRRHLKRLISVALPTMFITASAGWDAPEAYRDSLGRIAFIASMLAFTVFTERILRFRGGVLESELSQHPQSWIARSRYLWYPLGVLVPLSLAVLAAMGYYYTARQLEGQLAASAWLVVGAIIVHDLVLRWFAVEQRRLAIAKAKEKREAARIAAQSNQTPGPESLAALSSVESATETLDLPTINEQTRRLTRIIVGMSVLIGLWFIWSQVLPALAMLDHVAVWQHMVTIDGKQVAQPVTLANLALAAVILFVMLAAASNLPGVLEVVVLQHLDMEPGSRYATTQILRYVIFAAGLSGAFNAIGGSWDQLQWIVAALGVGLGFGLQEIFANFVSGLILLFERPIRVGDTVTIRDISGTVSRIRIRTTTIIDWDRRALIVPNKTFITEQLINWSLDPMTRIVLKIGVAAGTEVALATQIIMDTVRAQPHALKEPEPTIYFMGVGEKTLNFELRVYVKELESRMPLMHALDINLHEAFNRHNIMVRIPC
jgi:potassium-dependent mechanosensitive channel